MSANEPDLVESSAPRMWAENQIELRGNMLLTIRQAEKISVEALRCDAEVRFVLGREELNPKSMAEMILLAASLCLAGNEARLVVKAFGVDLQNAAATMQDVLLGALQGQTR